MLKLLIFWCTRRSGTGAHSDQSLLHINSLTAVCALHSVGEIIAITRFLG